MRAKRSTPVVPVPVRRPGMLFLNKPRPMSLSSAVASADGMGGMGWPHRCVSRGAEAKSCDASRGLDTLESHSVRDTETVPRASGARAEGSDEFMRSAVDDEASGRVEPRSEDTPVIADCVTLLSSSTSESRSSSHCSILSSAPRAERPSAGRVPTTVSLSPSPPCGPSDGAG